MKIDPATLPQAPNIHYLGSKSYEQLPAYLAGWDAAILPFRHQRRDAVSSRPPRRLSISPPASESCPRPSSDVVRGYGDAGLVEIAGTAQNLRTHWTGHSRGGRHCMAASVGAAATNSRDSSWDSTWQAMHRENETAQPQNGRRAPSHSLYTCARASQTRLRKATII